MRIVITLKRDAVAKVVLNNLYKHTAAAGQTSVCNMLAIVDGVPRTLRLDQDSCATTSTHQIEVIVRRTRYRLRKAEERIHILRGYLKALDAARRGHRPDPERRATVDDSRTGLMALLEVDDIQATAILDMQLRRLAALERQKIIDEHDEIQTRRSPTTATSWPSRSRQRTIVREELTEIIEKYGDDRRTRIIGPDDGDMSPTRTSSPRKTSSSRSRSTGYAKRTKTDLYRRSGAAARACRARR